MEQTHLKHIGQMVRDARISRNLSQSELESLLQQTGPTADIGRIELGKRNITINTLVRIFSSLQFTLDISASPADPDHPNSSAT